MSVDLKILLDQIIDDDLLHAKWLNTLSYLENCGAKKIARCEHPTIVKEEMLKHASEEFRHAYYLKVQIEKITPHVLPDYSKENILGGSCSLRYLNKLDLMTSAYLIKTLGLRPPRLKEVAYLLVTFAIELRALEFYPLYHDRLKAKNSKANVKSILLEEEEHLQEMKNELSKIPEGFLWSEKVCQFESLLCQEWLEAVQEEVFQTAPL